MLDPVLVQPIDKITKSHAAAFLIAVKIYEKRIQRMERFGRRLRFQAAWDDISPVR